MTGRKLMWRALAHLYGEAAIKPWRLTISDGGRPVVWDTRRGCRAKPDVSISHSGNIAACAISEQVPLGLDVERRKPRDWQEVAPLVFSPQEICHLNSLGDARRLARHYELWCLKEAYMKAAGFGMSLPISHISFLPDNRLEHVHHLQVGEVNQWRFTVPHIARGFSCALAWRVVAENHDLELVIRQL